jgi:hypothetical protein
MRRTAAPLDFGKRRPGSLDPEFRATLGKDLQSALQGGSGRLLTFVIGLQPAPIQQDLGRQQAALPLLAQFSGPAEI